MDSRKRRRLVQRAQVDGFGGINGRNQLVTCKAEGIAADGVVPDSPGKRDKQERGEGHQACNAAWMEIEKGEDQPSEENPECRPVSQNHEPKNRPGSEKEHERRHKLVAFFHSLQG